MGKNKKLESLSRHEARDLLLSVQEKINHYTRQARKNFDLAMKADRKKSEIEAYLHEIEDWNAEKSKKPPLLEKPY